MIVSRIVASVNFVAYGGGRLKGGFLGEGGKAAG